MNETIIPVKRSPLFANNVSEWVTVGGWGMPAFYTTIESELNTTQIGVGLADGSANGRMLVEGKQAKRVATNQNSAASYQLRPDQYFVHTLPDAVENVINQLNQESVTVTDMSHGWAELLLIGNGSANVLSRVCGLDFHENQFPNKTAKFSSVAKTRQLIIRRDIVLDTSLNKMPAYAIIGARSLAMYLWQTLLQAGRSDQIAPIGQQTLSLLADRA